MSLILDEHREYLSDEVRLSCFRNAIAEVVHPGDIVVDLGAGTGVLGLFACQAGAGRVYSIEQGPIVSLAQQICRANGFADRVSFIKSLSLKAEIPQRADVVIADQIGFFGFEAGILQYFSDARHRFLSPGGKMIPSALELWAAPVEIPELYINVDFWNNRPANLDFSAASSVAANALNSASFEAKHLLSQPQKLASLDLLTAIDTVIKVKSTCTIERTAQLHGIGGWFSAQLSPSVTMTNSPVESSRIGRKNAFLPLEHPLQVNSGDRVNMALHIVPREGLVSWNLEISRDENSTQTSAVVFRQSTFKGILLREDDLRHTQPKFVPKLTSWGDARLSVLRLCDGHRQLTEIETEVYRRHTQLFRSPSEVASFVAAVVSHYSQ